MIIFVFFLGSILFLTLISESIRLCCSHEKKQTILSLCNKKVGSCLYSISHMGQHGSLVPGTLRAEGGSISVFFQDFQGRKKAMATHRVALKGIKRTYITSVHILLAKTSYMATPDFWDRVEEVQFCYMPGRRRIRTF